MRKTRTLSLLLMLLFLLTSCLREPWPGGMQEGVGVDFVIPFAAAPPPDMEVSTKSTLGLDSESMVYNLYVFIFNSTGHKIYGHYFDHTNQNNTGLANYWTVVNNDGQAGATSGNIHLHTESAAGCTIVVISNIDSEMVNISPEQLNTVETYDGLYAMGARLNQLIISRSGYFPMCGKLEGVDINVVNDVPSLPASGENRKVLTLRRLDAKIRFEVQIDKTSKIAEFTPLKWKVVNLPRSSYVIEHPKGNGGDLSSVSADFFDWPETNFETETTTKVKNNNSGEYITSHGFSFYMMENRKDAVGSVTTYADRERQVKTNGLNGDFEHAPALGTYVVISGRLRMDNVDYTGSDDITHKGATLGADVQYIIHLGDFGADLSDFSVWRNHTYTYKIYIKDVQNIRTEVEDSQENDPAAGGRVTVSLEEVYTSDSHYTSHVISFHAQNINASRISWEVKTPFNPNGAGPTIENGVENTTGLDYEWVEFRVNETTTTQDSRTVYKTEERQTYKPRIGQYADGKTMNISELVAYLKHQKELYDNPATRASSEFDYANATEDPDGPRITVTAFVNEYYYEKHPLTGESGEKAKDLWKQFVNQSMRFMYILSETKISTDQESEVIGASFTIQQHSIQSIYNINNPDLRSAWGSEYYSDTEESRCRTYTPAPAGNENRGNNDPENGRFDSMIEWGLLDGGVYQDKDWEDYLNLRAANTSPLLKDEYLYLRYSCMTRNRDNNGDGKIDPDEVRWYMGSSNQLICLFLGAYGIEGAARLYQRSAEQQASNKGDDWRQHVLASNCAGPTYSSDKNPRLIWAEEGLTGSNMANNTGTSFFSTRCVRNLGYDTATKRDITFSDYSVRPEPLITVKRFVNGQEVPEGTKYSKDEYFEFDCSRINDRSLRFYTDRELVMHDENAEAASLYKRFRAAPERDCPPVDVQYQTIDAMNAHLNTIIGQNPFCPTGYRLPNVREVAVIRNFLTDDEAKDYHGRQNEGHFMFSRTYWSFGKIGAHPKSNSSWGWASSYQKVLMANAGGPQRAYTARCVKDLKDD